MKLNYRGVDYNYTPAPVETREDAIAGKYRGAAFKFRTNAAKVPVLQPALDLLYRGVRYKTGTPQAATTQTVAVPVPQNAELIYRGVRYRTAATEAPVVQHRESLAEQARELVIQHRLKAERRDQSVLERFEEAIG
ncbi:DUF4278 domain-containing protein [Kovacikia minuta CCNUW1]|uniref:DUF4278 domain-containing protein n=1 Tax=Kovacikia minuta TaxID=2931930 RepID=UPI001CD02A0B|nr:DUF4278 domain-containing protein [Kovacikia minuta]UBF26683.1 DUF4278 domain-containing protein [Kovacikia minuta CCNUW1]